ncbi:unnamed protein product [Adineta ricciae]|uniref:Uncharacterized protein n=1 Tax=Adineta ricciae TaxID=249248 RepID=A0A815D0N3_ADIRI|nr:unnamed protein product [Adineta ricciae]
MANADELCQYARLGQISKIQKCLQVHNVDINALNLYGESALSTATYHNQLPTVEYLLANKADPKLCLSAGHTAIHIACRFASIPMLHLLLSIRKVEINDEDQQRQEDKFLYECLRIKDHASLTPIHWAATQESVTKRQKIFAYLDKRMPGVLDSRYNVNWFDSWAKTHPWVNELQSTKVDNPVSSPRLLTTLRNTEKINRQRHDDRISLPLSNVTPMNMTPRTSLIDHERISKQPTTATTNGYYVEIDDRGRQISPKSNSSPQASSLPITPITSCIVTSKHSILKYHDEQDKPSVQHNTIAQKTCTIENHSLSNTEKTPYSQRLTSIIKESLSPQSDRSTYRAERAHVIPTFRFPSHSSSTKKDHEFEDIMTPISSKRPSHNLLSNIAPSSTTPSSDQSSRRSSKPFASFGFDTSMDHRVINDTATLSTIEIYTPQDEETFYEDYLCKSASTLGISTRSTYS